jgi:hypothetical protein
VKLIPHQVQMRKLIKQYEEKEQKGTIDEPMAYLLLKKYFQMQSNEKKKRYISRFKWRMMDV